MLCYRKAIWLGIYPQARVHFPEEILTILVDEALVSGRNNQCLVNTVRLNGGSRRQRGRLRSVAVLDSRVCWNSECHHSKNDCDPRTLATANSPCDITERIESQPWLARGEPTTPHATPWYSTGNLLVPSCRTNSTPA